MVHRVLGLPYICLTVLFLPLLLQGKTINNHFQCFYCCQFTTVTDGNRQVRYSQIIVLPLLVSVRFCLRQLNTICFSGHGMSEKMIDFNL